MNSANQSEANHSAFPSWEEFLAQCYGVLETTLQLNHEALEQLAREGREAPDRIKWTKEAGLTHERMIKSMMELYEAANLGPSQAEAKMTYEQRIFQLEKEQDYC